MKILLDNGHGENTAGKRSPDGVLREYRYTRDITQGIERELRTRGYDVTHHNVSDATPTFVGFRFQKGKIVDTIYTSSPCSRKVIVRKFNGYNASDHNAVRVYTI